MKDVLALHETGHSGSGPDMRKWKHVWEYEVQGLPPTQQAYIAEMNGRWQILLIKDGVQGDWTCDYRTAEDALRQLEGGGPCGPSKAGLESL